MEDPLGVNFNSYIMSIFLKDIFLYLKALPSTWILLPSLILFLRAFSQTIPFVCATLPLP